MRMRHAAVMAGLALGLMSGAARATVVEYTSQAAFQAATGLSQQGFSGFDNPRSFLSDPTSIGPFTFTVPSGYEIYGYNDGGYGQGLQYVEFTNLNANNVSVNAVASPGAEAFGLTLGTYQEASAINVTVNGNGQLPVTTIGGHPSTVFLGFTSTSPITSLSLGVSSGELDVVNYSYQTTLMSPVPLPASAPMFGAALLALAAVGYGLKRKRAAAAA